MIRRPTAVLLLLLLLSVGTFPASAQQSPSSSLQALVSASLAKVASIRGLPAPSAPPPVVIRSRSETRRFVEQELNRKYPAARTEAERKAMVAWGVIPADFDLRGSLLDLLQEQAAAYYDPVRKVMVLADWVTPEMQQFALSHELVHALQDREIPLEQFLAPPPGHGDQLLARQALIEGEAVAISLELLLQPQGMDLARIPDLSTFKQLVSALSAGPVFARVPRFIQHLLLFPYVQGLTFVHQFRLKESWPGFSRLYRDPPRSTTQILHPEKFFGHREDPLPITLPDLQAIFAQGWRLISEDELGEWGLSELLATFMDEASGLRLATGWRGDRYQVWEDARGQLALIYRVRWQAEGPAEAFAQAYAGLQEKKHATLAGRAVKGAGSLWSWQDGARGFLVERRGSDVLVLERVPVVSVERIRQTIWP
jgi:hypothetical protein